MDTRILKDILAVIKAEQQRRASLLVDVDPNLANDLWLFRGEPFVNELCLMLLVALNHQIEGELVRVAARATNDREISRDQYQKEVRKLARPGGRETINIRLKLESCTGHKSIQALRFLANSYKHHPSMEPNEKLLDWLNLEVGIPYAPLAESHALQEGLADFIGLGKDATFCDITEHFINIANGFLADVQKRTQMSRVQQVPVSLVDFAR